mgnify:CR=1 FL=1
MLRKYLAFLLVLALVLLAGCAAQNGVSGERVSSLDRIINKNELVLGTTGDMPPLNMTTRDGKVIGLDIDIATYLATTMGVELRIERMKFSELLPALEAGKVDVVISGMTITPERNRKAAFVGPYFVSGKAFLTKMETIASADEVTDINTPGISLVALKGSTSEYLVQEVLPRVSLVTVDDYETAVAKVLDDSVQAMVADYPVCLVSILRHPDTELLSLITPLTYEPLGIALPADDPHLINLVENALSLLVDSGQLDRLTARWFDNDAWLSKLP